MKKILLALLIFTAGISKAQTACDSLGLTISYYPFSDTLLQIVTANQAQNETFPNPFFTIFSAAGDTIANELPQWCFSSQIGQGSYHLLRIYPGMLQAGQLTGIVQLYYTTVDSYAYCTRPVDVDLCPANCTNVYPYLGNPTTTITNGDAAWSITDNNNQVLASGIFSLDQSNQTAMDSVCLYPGHYTFTVDNNAFYTSGMRVVGLGVQPFGNGPAPNTWTTDSLVQIPFSFYEACINTTGITQHEKQQQLRIYSYENTVYIDNRLNTPIGQVTVYSIDGKIAVSETCMKPKQVIDLSGMPPNMYIIRVVNDSGTYTHKAITGN